LTGGTQKRTKTKNYSQSYTSTTTVTTAATPSFDFTARYEHEPWGATLKSYGDEKYWEVHLPAAMLVAFCANAVQGRIVSAIESLDVTKEPHGQTL
jgi:hypothetical protein